jgi:LysR family transcriptional regulator, glycine cleavage system transcriptional activator
VQPTDEGARLAAKLTHAFNLINAGIGLMRPAPLKLSCSSTIMMHWLLPRLGGFKERHPNIELRLNVNYGVVDFVHDEISVAIRVDRIHPPKDVLLEPLIPEEIGPVCSPDNAERHAITHPKLLENVRLLAPATRPTAWRDWSVAAGHPTVRFKAHEVFEHFYLQNQAAACGLGVALTPRILVEDQIAVGRLVAPFGFVPGPFKLVLWIAPHLRMRPDLRALVSWLKDAIRKAPDGEATGGRDRRMPRGSRT